jgi:TonB family protein
MNDPRTIRQAMRVVALTPVRETGRWPLRVWIFAAIGAVVLHGGAAALAVATMPADDDAAELGTNAIEVDYERMAPKAEPMDLPAGPNSDASAASPAVEEQKEVLKETNLPQATPTDTEDPDRIVTPDDKKKPVEEEVETPKAPALASAPAVATEATATPSSETAVVAERSAAPELGLSDSLRRKRAKWGSEVSAYINKYLRYPADRANKAAEAAVTFEIDRTGHVLSVSIATSSGDKSFDDAALAMVRRADPVPPPPPLIADEGLTFTIPVNFRVKSAHR